MFQRNSTLKIKRRNTKRSFLGKNSSAIVANLINEEG